MDDNVLRALYSLKGLADKVLARLNQNLDRHVVGDVVVFDKLAADLVLGLGRAGEAYLDLLKSHVDERVEEFQLFVHGHGVDKRLIAVAQVNAAPNRRFGNGIVRPSAVGQIDLLEWNVLLIRRFHDKSSML